MFLVSSHSLQCSSCPCFSFHIFTLFCFKFYFAIFLFPIFLLLTSHLDMFMFHSFLFFALSPVRQQIHFFFFCPLSLSGSRSGSSFKQCTQMVCHRNTNTEGTSRWWKNQTKATGFSMAMQDLGLVLLGKNKIHWPSSVRFEKTVPSVMSIRPWAILEHSFFPIRTSQLVNSIIMFIPHKILRLWYLVFLASPSRIYLAPPSQISISHI